MSIACIRELPHGNGRGLGADPCGYRGSRALPGLTWGSSLWRRMWPCRSMTRYTGMPEITLGWMNSRRSANSAEAPGNCGFSSGNSYANNGRNGASPERPQDPLRTPATGPMAAGIGLWGAGLSRCGAIVIWGSLTAVPNPRSRVFSSGARSALSAAMAAILPSWAWPRRRRGGVAGRRDQWESALLRRLRAATNGRPRCCRRRRWRRAAGAA